ncbi:MAG: hypothetical protein H6R10_2981 [Rhodocyclaceae bacterium]|nr:hypothetical protein [Rhodocyclaceae bacterium]
MKNTNNNSIAHSTAVSNAKVQGTGAGTLGAGPAFFLEAVAPCLADLKRQLELRQSMH